MNAKERTAFLNKLDPEQRAMAVSLFAYIDAEIAEIDQASIKRSAGNADKLSSLQLQLDRYDQDQLDEVREKLERASEDIADHERRLRALEQERQVGERDQERE